MENGRMAIPPDRLDSILEAYGFTRKDFFEYCQGKDLPINRRDECIEILRHLKADKVAAVHAMLISLTGNIQENAIF